MPRNIQSGMHAQYVSGFNPSDDLFMFMKKKIAGLQPNTHYNITFTIEFASIYPTNAVGVGGAPGEGVTMKAGMTLIEPDTIIIDKGGQFVAMNIDKGNQSQPGPDMDTIGHVGVSDTTTVYALKTNDNVSHPFSFSTDHLGEAWFIVGTDSGFESTTAIYYTHIEIHFTQTTGIKESLTSDDILIYPNPSSGIVNIRSTYNDIKNMDIYDIYGRHQRSVKIQGSNIELNFSPGVYIFNISTGTSTFVKRILVQ